MNYLHFTYNTLFYYIEMLYAACREIACVFFLINKNMEEDIKDMFDLDKFVEKAKTEKQKEALLNWQAYLYHKEEGDMI